MSIIGEGDSDGRFRHLLLKHDFYWFQKNNIYYGGVDAQSIRTWPLTLW